VVHDSSVYWIYAILTIAIVGVSLAILVPYRSAWALLVESDDGPRLHVVTRHTGRDPGFALRVERALSHDIPAEEDAR